MSFCYFWLRPGWGRQMTGKLLARVFHNLPSRHRSFICMVITKSECWVFESATEITRIHWIGYPKTPSSGCPDLAIPTQQFLLYIKMLLKCIFAAGFYLILKTAAALLFVNWLNVKSAKLEELYFHYQERPKQYLIEAGRGGSTHLWSLDRWGKSYSADQKYTLDMKLQMSRTT